MAGSHIPPSAWAAPKVALAPEGVRPWLADAVRAGGGEIVGLDDAEVLVWAAPGDPDGLLGALRAAPRLRWVQLPWAGIEPYRHALDPGLTWTSGKGVYAQPVAELALALGLGGLRAVPRYTRAATWEGPHGRMLFGANVVVLGGGGIAEVFLRLVAPWQARVTVVRRHPAPMAGAAAVVGPNVLVDVLADADLVVLALALTPETDGIIGLPELEVMPAHAWIVNVARGRHIVTDDLVEALRDDAIGGAALDVTDPEPLPDGHPLWTLPNCVITPHVGNTPEMAVPLLSARVTENIRRWAAGDPLLGPVDPALGY